MKNWTVLLAVFIVVVTLIYVQRTMVVRAILQTGMDKQFGRDIAASLDDGLHLSLCGAGGPMPAPNASGPCVAIVAGNQTYVIDAGTDGIRNLLRMGYQVGDINAVFLTHFHSDHIDGLGELATYRWAGGANTSPLPVYGPDGVERVVDGFNIAYAGDFQYRQDHHGDTVAPLSGAGMEAREFAQPAPGTLTTVYKQDGLTVEALKVQHAPVDPAVGYIFTYKGRKTLISGDTAKSANLQQFATGVDLLVHEALSPELVSMLGKAARRVFNPVLERIAHDIPDYHTSPVEAAEIARAADVGHLLYYHIVPPLLIPGHEALFVEGVEDIFEDYTVGYDGVAFFLPAGSDDIIQTRSGL